MKITLAFLLSLSSFSILGSDTVNVAHCGARPSFLENLFTNAESIRVKCIDEAYEANRIKVLEEANQLSDMIKAMEVELKVVAYEYSYAMIKCTPRNSERRDEARIKKCREINEARNSVIGRMNDLMGWNTRAEVRNENTTIEEITPPCPSKSDLDKMKPVRYFNRSIYQTWERCVQLNPMNYYN
ncbi:MAG: hypothetical protein COW01_00230 [Bdellovibrionales bacterium CG12_big_fil_rev_8_21_14_0_65_38_15]|nr:MAG: hypothetical protein COW79_14120 [Bdellovibrionales bacterium CG22_combo_CG10-13_8_21_14_all_38_13]PIQ57396.1 MAG: hypothetical protein COW01_00230 [Bdellovibrionales bacterium CG12_big_fil_rev_8_21_14_0_65_38_15]PIR31116.1 MAG: hypothetical protein COV38_01710 [Bdellovibrionales bacterium CG11_big_fil_rev_8_21_14_0_20_38_13]